MKRSTSLGEMPLASQRPVAIVRGLELSGSGHNYGGIRPAMHPASLRCSSLKYGPVFSVVAPCEAGASPVSVRRRNNARDH